jgi:hypothetical protein
MRLRNYFTTLLLVFSAVTNSHAAVAYNENISGDLSNSGILPTAISLAPGSNQILGSTGLNLSDVDRDYFTITIPTDAKLNSINLLPGTSIGGEFSFIGLQGSNQVTLPTNAFSASGLLGWWHYSDGDINTDILSKMAIASNGSSGFLPPLGSGSYSFWVQDFNPGPLNYGFELNVSQVPLPSAYLVFLSGMGLLGWVKRPSKGRYGSLAIGSAL